MTLGQFAVKRSFIRKLDRGFTSIKRHSSINWNKPIHFNLNVRKEWPIGYSKFHPDPRNGAITSFNSPFPLYSRVRVSGFKKTIIK